MTLVLFIIAVILIGWFAPRPIVDRVDGTVGLWVACISALLIGVAVIWLGAQAAELAGLGDAKTEFDRGFNAWKIMLFVAPASAVHRRRQTAKGD
ncbi:MAG: hypothetical protein AAGH74_01040 [Pseudomonadota bacterium]